MSPPRPDLGGEPGPRFAVILCSGSPARLATLRAAGLAPEVMVSNFDENSIAEADPRRLVGLLAAAKARTVFASLPNPASKPRILLGCDSLLLLDGVVHGKPLKAEVAYQRWQQMRGRTAELLTGHQVIVTDATGTRQAGETAVTRVTFAADLSAEEIAAYVATGEPLEVAGGFTVDGRAGAFITGIVGDHHNVVGISLPLVRRLLKSLGVAWPQLWAR